MFNSFRCGLSPIFGFVVALALSSASARGQASVSFLSQRVFVTGVTPIIGPNGGVGGVDVDASGVLKRAEVRPDGELADDRAAARRGVAGDIRRKRRPSRCDSAGRTGKYTRETGFRPFAETYN